MKYILLFFVVLSFTRLQAQNLVPNESFEEVNVLPCSWIIAQSEFTDAMQNWYMPTYGSSDIFSTETPDFCYSSCSSTNSESRGHQKPRTGKTMCGFNAFGFGFSENYREYLGVKLKSPLEVGKTYYAEMYVSFADKCENACNNLGMYFSTYKVENPFSTDPLPVLPQVNATTIIWDSVQWVKISGTFVATAAWEYLTIGNFFYNFETSTQHNPRLNTFPYNAYYYIDDVVVRSNCLFPSPDLTICEGSTVTLLANSSNTVQWAADTLPATIISTNDQLTVSPNKTTRYFMYSPCDTLSTLVTVDQMPDFDFGNDTSLCQGQSIVYDVTSEHASYRWQDGYTLPVYTVDRSGHYSVAIDNGTCHVQDEVNVIVDVLPTFQFGDDTLICEGEVIVYDATTPEQSHYLWQDGSVNPKYIVHHAGTYTVRITNTCGNFDQAITIGKCCETISIPNLITPNGDGLNEDFTIGCLGSGGWNLEVYNAWGTVIYSSSDYQNDWDAHGISSGVYYYKVTKVNKPSYNGWLHIIRD